MPHFIRPPKEAYSKDAWLQRETEELFPHSWVFIGCTFDLANEGDYRTIRTGNFSLFVVKTKEGTLQAFHNICRHRGAELLDDEKGNTGRSLICPYHRWSYGLNGALRGLPNKNICFPDLDRTQFSLKPAAIGIIQDLIFVNPDPEADFKTWIAPLAEQIWPHQLIDSDVKEAQPLIYDLKCNWKVFVENALDGYHLAYLHENTLGGPLPDENIWHRAGEHLIWHATQEGIRHRLPKKIRDENGAIGTIKSAAKAGYGGVFYLFPTTLIVPTPYGLSISSLQPTAPNRCQMKVRHWVGPWQHTTGREYIPGFDKKSGIISSEHWTQHPLETKDFQTEDIWICEKVQRGLESPAYEHGPLSQGAGAEEPLQWFYEMLLSKLKTL